jgi:hypothetical protein
VPDVRQGGALLFVALQDPILVEVDPIRVPDPAGRW